jgi:hypothetical protein
MKRTKAAGSVHEEISNDYKDRIYAKTKSEVSIGSSIGSASLSVQIAILKR